MGEERIEGLRTIQSPYGPEETLDRLTREITSRGMSVFARINHAALAAEAGLALPPTEVIIFGNPRGGTPLMQVNQTIGIDLPLKALVWQDLSGTTWLSWNDPEWLAARHYISRAGTAVDAMNRVLEAVSSAATGSPPKK